MAKLTPDQREAIGAAFDARDRSPAKTVKELVARTQRPDTVSLQLRLPRSLHARLASLAALDHRSLNGELVMALDGFARLRAAPEPFRDHLAAYLTSELDSM